MVLPVPKFVTNPALALKHQSLSQSCAIFYYNTMGKIYPPKEKNSFSDTEKSKSVITCSSH